MRKRLQRTPGAICGQCGSPSLRNVRRARVHKGIIIENIPATYCSNCGEEVYDLATAELIERIAAEPEIYATVEPRAVARMA